MWNLSFAWPYAAILFLAPLAFYFIQRKTVDRFYLKSPLLMVIKNISKAKVINKSHSPFPLWSSILWTLMVLALMRPVLVAKPVSMPRSGRSIMLVLDISESMESKDISHAQALSDRISIAKSVLFDFINHRQGDGLGLVVFGSEPFLHAPVSFDHKTIKRFLEDSQVGFAGPKTAIGDAIGLSIKKLIEQPNGERLIILLTDGQNNAGKLDPVVAAELAQKEGIKLYIVGLGASEIAVEGFFGRSLVNPSRDLEEAEPTLKKMASMTSGSYFRAKDAQGLEDVYKQIDSMEPVVINTRFVIPSKDLFFWPLGLMIALLLARVFWQRFRQSHD
jgi:Ca-activated chloride channel family protein